MDILLKNGYKTKIRKGGFMLKNSEKKTSKKFEDIKLKDLGKELARLQREIQEKEIPVLIIFEGFDASGKGTMINEVIRELDPRGYKVRVFHESTEEEQRKPFLWRFWQKIPKKGQIVIFDRSWYRRAMEESHFDVRTMKEDIEDIKNIEKQLSDDGVEIIKIFLHISKETQKNRLKSLESDEATSWRVKKKDINQNENYDYYYSLFDGILTQTNYSFSPWDVVVSENKTESAKQVLNIIEKRLKRRIQVHSSSKDSSSIGDKIEKDRNPVSWMIDRLDLSLNLDKKEYNERLNLLQSKIENLSYTMYRKKIPMILVFEGWDASGKGGAIKRLTFPMDPRGFEVIPISAPDETEKEYHYLWRFWKDIPKTGHTAIFDRSWYGRVMVERVEGFAKEHEWMRAYEEINQFEKHLKSYNAVILKFFIHVDKDEQLQRFEKRKNDKDKSHKLTEEDWRNREKWEEYKNAIGEMIEKTDTLYAPWIVIEGNSKKYARIKVLEEVSKAMELAIGEYKLEQELSKEEGY